MGQPLEESGGREWQVIAQDIVVHLVQHHMREREALAMSWWEYSLHTVRCSERSAGQYSHETHKVRKPGMARPVSSVEETVL
jgi:hypothetical protein